MTIDQHAAAVRHNKDGHDNLVTALRSDPALMKAARDRLNEYAAMERVDRLRACWISRTTKDILTAAIGAAKQKPGVPA